MLNISKHVIRPENEDMRLDQYRLFETMDTPRFARILAYWVLTLLGLGVAVLFVPWQQNIQGYGTLTALAPEDRAQKVYPTFSGRISRWSVMEGQHVEAGQEIARLSEIKDYYFDPQILDRTDERVAAQEQAIQATERKAEALSEQLVALREGRQAKLEMAYNKISQLLLKINMDSAKLDAEGIAFQTAQAQFDRQQELFDEGLSSLTELENKRLKWQEVQAKLVSAQNKLATTRNEYINTKIDVSVIKASFDEKIAKTLSDRNETLAKVSDLQSKLVKLRVERSNLEVRQDYYSVRAPQSGYVVKAHKEGVGEIVKESEALVTIMPDNAQRAVELYVIANDVPLLNIGDKVRVQFDGYPAFVFSGWPGASLGTYGGVIQVIDAVNSYENRFRVLVVPDPEDIPWPPEDKLRMGSGVYGWAMLNTVQLWYELWRQINAFPPMPTGQQGIDQKDGEKDEKGGKKPKDLNLRKALK